MRFIKGLFKKKKESTKEEWKLLYNEICIKAHKEATKIIKDLKIGTENAL